MDTASPPKMGAIRFGSFEVDLRAGEVRKAGVRIKLQEQPFQVLQVLLEKSGEIVTREELRNRIWPATTFVDFDCGVNNAIKRLRDALGDHVDHPRYIETIPRKGYRFVATVVRNTASTVGTSSVVGESMTDSRYSHEGFRKRMLVGTAVGALLLASVAFTANWRHRIIRMMKAGPEVRSIGVLPLDNLSHDPEQEFLSDGMTDELINRLGQIKGVRVVSRTSSAQFKART
ncbi:MAG: winged helix-turn-helix domain-containing protein [Acidobacteriota bacterium]